MTDDLFLTFDLETVGLPFESFDEAQQEYLLRYTETDAEREKKINEFALSPVTGRIVCIGMRLMRKDGDTWALENDVAYALDVHADVDAPPVKETLPSGATSYLASEEWMLTNFWRLMGARQPYLISFNGRGFDAPWLMLRSAILGIRPSRNLMAGTKFNYPGHTDLLDELSYYSGSSSGATRRFNFDMFAKAFGVVSPKSGGVDGSKVGALFEAGEMTAISEYCLRDVRATWELYVKWRELLKF